MELGAQRGCCSWILDSTESHLVLILFFIYLFIFLRRITLRFFRWILHRYSCKSTNMPIKLGLLGEITAQTKVFTEELTWLNCRLSGSGVHVYLPLHWCTSLGSIEYSLLWLSSSAHIAQDRAANMGKKGFSEGMRGERAVNTTARMGNPLSTFPGDWRFRMLGQKAVNTVKNGGYLVYGKMFWMFCFFPRDSWMILNLWLIRNHEQRAVNSQDLHHLQP